MNRFFTLLLAASCLTAVGQVTYPYNPDGNADGDIAVGDLQDFLVTYGNPFSPSEIMVGDSSLTYWVEQLSQTVQEQQTELNNLNHPLALAETDIKAFHELIWNPECFDGPAGRVFSVFNPDGDGFLRLAGSNQTDFKCVIVDDSVEVCNRDEAQELFSLRFWEGTLRNMTIPLHQKEKVIFFVHAESIQPEEVLQRNGLFWNALITNQIEPAEDNLGPCQGEFTVNYHGYDYELVEIGNQCWFAENVRFLPRKATSGANVNQGSEDNGLPYSYVYGEDSNDLDVIASSATLAEFGALYNFQASIVWDLCPSGWHIPSDADWMKLEAFVGVPEGELTSNNWRGTAQEAGKKLKSIFWSGTDEYGFGALPGGARYAVNDWQWSGGPGSEEPYALFMTSSFMNGGEVAIAMRSVRFDEEGIWRGPLLENPTGLSVRCIKD